ncbi:MAG: hypothetical protein LBF49_02635 [Puniceicoccales bacterium]|jgi:hypothetical protein|nr:hypothetical protein [Puniceicoccales bacterium]
MERVKRTQPDQDDGQVVERPVEEDELFSGVFSMEGEEKMITLGGEGISIPWGKVPDDVLETRSAEVPTVPPLVIPLDSTLKPPMSWPEFTLENTAGLREDEIVRLLLFQGRPDPSKFGIVLFLPDGESIAIQLINGIPADRLLRFVGENRGSADNFMCVFFGEGFFVKDMDQVPTIEDMRNSVSIECEPFPPGLPEEKFEERITVVAQAMKDAYADKGKRGEFEDKLRNVMDLIFAKLPLPDMENQMCWDNIRRATIDNSYRFYGTDGEKKLAELRERFPVLDLILSWN